MSTEDRKALPIPPDLFDALLKAIRETVRAEMRAEFEARRRSVGRDVLMTENGPVPLDTVNGYQVPTTMHGQPI